MNLSLTILVPGPRQGQTIPITLPRFLIGRDSQSHLQADSPAIHLRHCLVERRDDRAFVRDLESLTGTFVNEQRISGEVQVRHGDRLRVGPLIFGITIVSESKAVPDPPRDNSTGPEVKTRAATKSATSAIKKTPERSGTERAPRAVELVAVLEEIEEIDDLDELEEVVDVEETVGPRDKSKGGRARKRRAKAEAKRRRQQRMTRGGLAAGVLVSLCVMLVIVLRNDGKPGPEPGADNVPAGARNAAPGGAPDGFVVVDAVDATPPLDAAVAKRKAQRKLAKKLAQQAPPFDPDHPPVMRSTFGQLASRTTIQAHLIEMGEKALQGTPLPATGEGKFLESLLRGQRIRQNAAPEKSKGAWERIPIDSPSEPFKLNLPTGIPLEASPGASLHLGVMNGPYLVPFPWWLNFRQGRPTFELRRDPKNKKRYVAKVLAPLPAHPIIDIRDGRTVGEFNWGAPVWANSRLSPDGSYLVGADTHTTLDVVMTSTHSFWENGAHLLCIWAKGKKSPATWKVPGVVDWMEFVGPDQLAYVTYAPDAVMRIHDVAKNKPAAEIPLTGVEPAPMPDQLDGTPVYPGVEFYRPMARRGAVSAGGKYVALGCQDGVRLISVPERKVIGLLPMSKVTRYRSLNFSSDGGRLFGVLTAQSESKGDGRGGRSVASHNSLFRSWSAATGGLLDESSIDPYEGGPIFPGPMSGLYVGSKFFFTRQPLKLEAAPLRIVRIDDEGTALVIGSRAKAPADTPPCRSVTERLEAKQARFGDDRKDLQFALFTTKLDWSGALAKVAPIATLISPRPAAQAGNKSGVVAQKPVPPNKWTPPSFAAVPAPPAEGDDPRTMHQFGAWPVSFGDSKAAVLRYVPKAQPRKRWEVWLDLLDRATGKRAAPAAKLWDWALYPDDISIPDAGNPNYIGRPPLPAIGALRPDAGLFALIDPDDCERVDLFKPNGERVFGLVPNPGRRIDWLGWSQSHLLTIAGGRLAAWEPLSGKALFEVEGAYTYAAVVSPDRKWAALWTGKHVDILDSATGKCLGRCQAGGFNGRLQAFTVSPDGKRLAATFAGWPKNLNATGPGNTAVVWNLETGKAGLHGFPGGGVGTPPVTTCAWAGPEHLLVNSAAPTEPAMLIDVRLGIAAGAHSIARGAYPGGQPLVGSPDGRLWCPTTAIIGAPKGYNRHDPNHPDFPDGFVWRTVSVPGLYGKDAYLADPAREWFDPLTLRVRLEVKAGDESQSEAIARSFARAVQAQGFEVGPGGTVLRVEGTLEDTESTIQFRSGLSRVKIPRCVVSARWLSPQGGELWQGKHVLSWNMSHTRYKVSEKNEFGPGGMTRYEYDFKGRNPSTAMGEELLEKVAQDAGKDWLRLPEHTFLHVQGRDHPVPANHALAMRMPPAMK